MHYTVCQSIVTVERQSVKFILITFILTLALYNTVASRILLTAIVHSLQNVKSKISARCLVTFIFVPLVSPLALAASKTVVGYLPSHQIKNRPSSLLDTYRKPAKHFHRPKHSSGVLTPDTFAINTRTDHMTFATPKMAI